MSDIAIRTATHDDLDAVVVLWCALNDAQKPYRIFPLAPDADAFAVRAMAEAIDGDAHRILVADRDGDIVGMTVVEVSDRTGLTRARVAKLSRVVVRPDARGKGIGEQLVGEAERFARALGAEYLAAWVLSRNARGRRFWKRIGFQPRFEELVRPILPAGNDSREEGA